MTKKKRSAKEYLGILAQAAAALQSPVYENRTVFAKLQKELKFNKQDFVVALKLLDRLANEGVRVIACVDGGNTQGAKANIPVDFSVLDYDNMEACEDEPEKYADDLKDLKDLEAEFDKLPIGVY